MVGNQYNSKFFGLFQTYPQYVIIAFGTLLRLPLLFTPLSFSSDGWRQTDTASIAYHFFANGYKLFYPQIFWGGNGPGYVETEFQLYPFIISLSYYLFGEHYWLGKLVSLLFSISMWLVFYLLAKKILGASPAANWALLFLVFSPLSLRYSVAFMPEATVMFLYIASLFYFVRWSETSKKGHLCVAAIASAFAILVKPTAIHIGLIFALFALTNWGISILKRWEIWLASALALIPGFLWFWHARNIYLTYGNTFGILSGGDNKFINLDLLLSPHIYYHLPFLDMKWILGFGATLLFIMGLIIVFKEQKLRLILFGMITISIYYLIVARYSHQEWGIHYHLYMLPFMALTTGLGTQWMLTKYSKSTRAVILGLSLALFFGMTTLIYYEMLTTGGDPLSACANSITAVVPPDDLIVVSTTNVALEDGVPNNYQEPQIFFYSKHYGWSFPADQHTPEQLAAYQELGAKYFVIYSQQLLESNPELKAYLKDNATQVGPGIEAGCGIYHLSRQ